MPQVSRLDALSENEMQHWFAEAMACIGDALAPYLAAVPLR
jgi:hypothetical protein